MMPEWVIYHNPRCGKSRTALELLEEKGIDPTVIRYLNTPPDLDTLRDLVAKLGIRPHELVRKNEKIARELTVDFFDDESALEAMAEHPILIERPIVVHKNRAVLGRPPAKVLELIDR